MFLTNEIKNFCKRLLIIFTFFSSFTTIGCTDVGVATMEASEMGVVYRSLPTILGGGLSDKVIRSGEAVFLWPWESVIRVKSLVQEVSWDLQSQSSLRTRASDGNELSLDVTIRYQISTDSKKLVSLIQKVNAIAFQNENTDLTEDNTPTKRKVDDKAGAMFSFSSVPDVSIDDVIRNLIAAVARADIRNSFNNLTTSQFTNSEKIIQIQDQIKEMMNKRLEWVDIVQVKLKNFHFEPEYQEMLNSIQEKKEETIRERERIQTIRKQKEEQYNLAMITYNEKVKNAEGLKKQAVIEGNTYLKIRQNEGEEIKAKGDAEIKGILAQIQAMSNPGAVSILKIKLAKELVKANPKFIVLNNTADKKGNNSLSLNKVDTNQLLQQMGLIELNNKEKEIK